MGVPAFYRWLREKYPHCIEDCVEEEPAVVDGVEVPVNISAPNPNKIEFDNLYLDMNGIIHPCVHPEDAPAPETLDEMFEAICEYVDRLVAAVRPRRILFLAIDGVAPRAKMNQQRSRRFKAAQEMAEEEQIEDELRAVLRSKGQSLPPKKKSTFDHNVITPGTEFMDRLSRHLCYHVIKRQAGDAGWRDLHVILSDASVPGEGEHKIMEFVRQQRAQPGYNPNTAHCLHGLDADLIMLGLATHEPHFSILREDILGKPSSKCFVCGRDGHQAKQCSGFAAAPAEAAEPTSVGHRGLIQRKPLQFLHLSTLREYLDIEFRAAFGVPPPPPGHPTGLVAGNPAAGASAALPFAFDIENAIDDFVFLCFFVGNDFLPHLPSMDIREGAIDLLMALYKLLLPSLGGYITRAGVIDLARADVLLGRVGAVEDEIFRRRRVKEERDKRRDEQQAAEAAAAKQRAQAQRQAAAFARGGGMDAADVLELAVMSVAGAGAADKGGDGAALQARRLLEASVATVEAERAAMGAVPAVIHHAVTAGLGARVEVMQADPAAAAAGRQQRVASLLLPVVGVAHVDSTAAAAAAAVAATSTGPAGAASGGGGGQADGINRSAAAALRARLMGRTPAAPPAPAPPEADAAAAPEAADAAPLAGAKRRREGEGTADAEPSTDGTTAPAIAAQTTDGAGAAAAAPKEATPADSGMIPPQESVAAVSDAVLPDEDDLFAAPLGAEELGLLAPAEVTAVSPPADALASAAPSSLGGADADALAITTDASADATPEAAAAAAEADADDDAPPDGDAPPIAAGINSMLRGAVLKTIQAKRTHVGAEDNVRFGAAGWKDRYYVAKFGPEAGADPRFRRAMCTHYIEGLCWVLQYYYKGVASWGWYFPYHYAPFASDLRNLDREVIKFELGVPFSPMGQLMGVLPPRSAHALPPAVQTLMTEPASAIADFYPTRFEMDPNGKRFTWQWVVLLPFIDAARLLTALGTVEATFSAEERRRNRTGNDLLFVHAQTILGGRLLPLLLRDAPPPLRSAAADSSCASLASDPADGGGAQAVVGPAAPPQVMTITLRPDLDDAAHKGLSGVAMSLAEGGAAARGLFAPRVGETFPSPWRTQSSRGPDVQNVQTALVLFLSPARRLHRCALLPGAMPPPRVLEDGRDDPSTRLPKLSRGMNVADLAYVGEPAGGPGRARQPPGPQQPFMQQGGFQQQPRAPMMDPRYAQPQFQQQFAQQGGFRPDPRALSYGGGPPPGYGGLPPGYGGPPPGYGGTPPGYGGGAPPGYGGGPPPPGYGMVRPGGREIDLGPAQRMIHAAVGRPSSGPVAGGGGPALPRPYGQGGAIAGAAQLGVQQQQQQPPRFSFAPGGAGVRAAPRAIPVAYSSSAAPSPVWATALQGSGPHAGAYPGMPPGSYPPPGMLGGPFSSSGPPGAQGWAVPPSQGWAPGAGGPYAQAPRGPSGGWR